MCGGVTLYNYRNNSCIEELSWNIIINNEEIMIKSLRYNNTYLFFNSTQCDNHANNTTSINMNQNCGNVTGYIFPNIMHINRDRNYNWAYFNVTKLLNS